MKMRIKGLLQIVISLCCLWSVLPVRMMAGGKDFVVVIDAGHGGKDPGAVGRKAKEKAINLNVALELGRLIKSNCNDVSVVYTRSTDVFVSPVSYTHLTLPTMAVV